MQLRHRRQILWIITALVMMVSLVFRVPGVRGSTQHQTVPTMPPPTESPTGTLPFTPTNPPQATATNAQATSTPPTGVTSIPPTQTAEAVASATIAAATSSPSRVPSVTLEAGTSSPEALPTQTTMAGESTNPQLTATLSGVTGATRIPITDMDDTEPEVSTDWLYGLILATAVLILVVLLVRWVQARLKERGGGKPG
jgi:hypothetical protein